MDETLAELNGSAVIDYHGKVVEIICRRNKGYHAFSVLRGTTSLDYSFTLLLLEISLVLIFSHIMRFLLKPLKQPKVISDVLAGIILGPSVLGHNETFAKNVIPENTRFVTQNMGIIGFCFFLFVMGVKMDLGVVQKAGKKHWIIAITGIIIPILVVGLVSYLLRPYMDTELRKVSSIGGVITAVAITTFPVIYSMLKDMHLVGSEIGRFALTTVIISDIIGISVIIVFEAIKQSDSKPINALYYVITIILVCGLVIGGVPQIMLWINKQTPEGKPVDQRYITFTLLGVFVIGFITDFIGAAIGNGPLWLGLAIPDGPPIGATIVQKSETFMNDILLPFSYATIGLSTDVYAMSACWSCVLPIFAVAVMGFVAKLVSVVMAARFTDMPYRDSIVLGLMLSLRGQTEFLLYMHWFDLKFIKTSSFTIMVIVTIIMTAIASPIINLLYDPTKPYMVNKKRTIQHTAQDSELRILACIYDQESVASLFNLLDFMNPTTNNPFKVLALYLVELVGRAAPVFIDHTKQIDEYWDNNDEAIHNAINLYVEDRTDSIDMNFFTSVTPQRTMYQDICEIALLNKVGFIILPFHKKCIEDGNDFSTALLRPGVQTANANTVTHAPCSVGLLACKNAASWGTLPNRMSQRGHRQFAMLFLGGPDAREGLSLADRMVGHPDVSLVVVRFLASEYRGDNESERKLDDGVVTWFWVKNERNDKVVYKEISVSNGFETVSAIQSLNESVAIDLWIVGRKSGINPRLLYGLSEWSDNPELGLIGDFLVSVDFNTSGSVLVVQQQVLRDQRASPWACY
ncbi:cation/H(+) antiporter 24-like [Amaranthus tricolor]|uniref:cation/H(+) antiporter 24-like n=1 Tax=Amaranthus tricolor TaxID=29722 RepID=UPI00258D27BE|nr:cation/H(+) antiporter 24-like [Amaranthus tricolor]